LAAGQCVSLRSFRRSRRPSLHSHRSGRHRPTRNEDELFGFTDSAHPLDLYGEIAWDSYCPISRLGNYPGLTVITCGLIITERLHGQSTGGDMKFITLCDYTGFIECEIFAEAYRRWGLATIRWSVVEVEGTVTPFENGNGFTLDVQRVGKPRTRPQDISPLGDLRPVFTARQRL
jgi:DNA polymerase III alpha subunit